MQLSRNLLRLQALGKHGEDRALPLSAVPEGRKRGSGDRDGTSSLTEEALITLIIIIIINSNS